jgi:hypothetical protein
MVNHHALTAAMIDSRDYLDAKRRTEIEPLMPAGTKIAFSGGASCNDHTRIWESLDKVLAKHPDMVLLHGGTPTGAERIAACWAQARKVPEIVFRPQWDRFHKAAPFKRNDEMLDTLPIGVIIFPGTGIQANLADKARRLEPGRKGEPRDLRQSQDRRAGVRTELGQGAASQARRPQRGRHHPHRPLDAARPLSACNAPSRIAATGLFSASLELGCPAALALAAGASRLGLPNVPAGTKRPSRMRGPPKIPWILAPPRPAARRLRRP